MDGKANSQTKEAEQTGETTITDATESKAPETPAASPVPATELKDTPKDATQ